ncbi:hypothetical protein NEOC84_001253|uniref:hypothetical protein n=1 Tax=Neochlamydia sp. AcF84 TaxID=2315858 RepID=UPI0014085EF8|nr:hypothetical protein [Neochlamydia sp. AcF84]NGY95337.1 hypothetical protein [Neochlamydia sp. AcF84]
MHAKTQILIRILLNRFHPKTSQEFLKCLPEDEAKQIAGHQIITAEIDPIFVKPHEFLKEIHYSWVAPYLRKLPTHLQNLMVSALPNPLATSLKKYLKINGPFVSMPKLASAFFTKKLYDQIKQTEILSPAFLPKQDLSILLTLSRMEIIYLIDFLGLYDLAEELRHVVDKKSLQKVYACLDNKKIQFVRLCLHQKSRFITAKMDLQKWKGEGAELQRKIHQRGLYRLGKALSGTHPHCMWYLLRKLDTGRSAIIEKHYKPQSNPAITSVLIQQVINVINFLKLKSEM